VPSAAPCSGFPGGNLELDCLIAEQEWPSLTLARQGRSSGQGVPFKESPQ
jgi:hypothetical protein